MDKVDAESCRQQKTGADGKSGQEVAKHGAKACPNRFRVEYWEDRLYKKTFNRGGVRYQVAEWSVRLQHRGRRESFHLGSANAETAAAKAKEIAVFLDANDWDATLAKFKPKICVGPEVCTLGEFLADVQQRSHLKAATVRRYAVMLRKIVSDITDLEGSLSDKQRKAKYDYVNGGHKAWLTKVDGQSLAVLTADAVAAWRNAYVAKAGTDPTARKSAERSAASFLRCSRALFAPDITGLLKVHLPPNPFAGVKIKDPGPQRYHSAINPAWLLSCAERELRAAQPQCYLAFMLCLLGGLRRKEADNLTWAQVDFIGNQIHVRRTVHFEPKTEESQRSIDIAPSTAATLRHFMEESFSEFVLEGGHASPDATYNYYRADATWRHLQAWLKLKGVNQRKAIHSLRKESGSLVASQFGIEAARQHLGHRDIQTTSAHYVEKRRRIEVQVLAVQSA